MEQIDNKFSEEDINLSKVDWNKLSIDEFHNLEQRLQQSHKLSKVKSGKRCSGNITVKIHGDHYSIKEVEYQRLKSMKSTKAKEKLINKIVSGNNPIEKI